MRPLTCKKRHSNNRSKIRLEISDLKEMEKCYSIANSWINNYDFREFYLAMTNKNNKILQVLPGK